MTTKMEKANVWDTNANISLVYCIHSITTKSTIYCNSWDRKIEIHTEFRSQFHLKSIKKIKTWKMSWATRAPRGAAAFGSPLMVRLCMESLTTRTTPINSLMASSWINGIWKIQFKTEKWLKTWLIFPWSFCQSKCDISIFTICVYIYLCIYLN